MPPPQKKFRIWISKWRLLVHSGDKFASFSSRRLNLILVRPTATFVCMPHVLFLFTRAAR